MASGQNRGHEPEAPARSERNVLLRSRFGLVSPAWSGFLSGSPKPDDAQPGCGGFHHNICPGYSWLRFAGSQVIVTPTDSPDRPCAIARGGGYHGAMPKASSPVCARTACLCQSFSLPGRHRRKFVRPIAQLNRDGTRESSLSALSDQNVR